MDTNFYQQTPSARFIRKWFIFNARTAPSHILTPEIIVQIFNEGYTRIYISMGYKFSLQQQELQKQESFQKSLSLLKDIQFEMVVIDCLNPPHQSITKLVPSAYYLMGTNRNPLDKGLYNSWEVECRNTQLLSPDSKAIKILNEFRNGPYTKCLNHLKRAGMCWQNIKLN